MFNYYYLKDNASFKLVKNYYYCVYLITVDITLLLSRFGTFLQKKCICKTVSVCRCDKYIRLYIFI